MNRRQILGAACVGLGLGAGGHLLWRRVEHGRRALTCICKAPSYRGELASIIRAGLAAVGVISGEIAGRSVLLKPNLVEANAGAEHINTHPLVVRAAIEAFLQLGAVGVWVGEGQGHERDTQLVLEESGLAEVLRHDRIRYQDLNYDSTFTVPNRSGLSRLRTLTLPLALRCADVVVSMPKLKTHHFAGVTLSMKNLFGVMPGLIYGWPKNALHQAGLDAAIVDICAAVRPQLAIVDGIVGMEGDGPIMGTPKACGVIVVGRSLPTVDATCARIMGIDPYTVPHLVASGGAVGPIAEAHIEQRGESIAAVRTPFTSAAAARGAAPFL